MAALRLLAELTAESRAPSPAEQTVLSRYSGWGALPQVFVEDPHDDWLPLQGVVRDLLCDDDWVRARASTINAHYTAGELATIMWELLAALGVDDGRVFEPGCGIGNFFGACPTPSRFDFVGVEVDPLSARIARLLYPAASVRTETLETARFPPGWFDAAIGNVPFASHAPFDPVYNRSGFSLHNYAIYKAARLTRPGGLVVVLTSAWSLDARNPAWRTAMAETADFVGAIRLPSGAHQATAGTRVVTDLVVFRPHHADTPAAHAGGWGEVVDVAVDGGVAAMNEWFADHPELIVGETRLGRGMYRDGEMLVDGPTGTQLWDRLRVAVADLAADAHRAGLIAAHRDSPLASTTPVGSVVTERAKDGSFHVVAGALCQVRDGVFVAYTPRFKRDVAEVQSLIRLRDAVVTVVTLESASPDDTDELVAARERLNRVYDAYHRVYGPVSRSTLTSSVDDDTGQVTVRRRNPSMGGFRSDPDFPLVLALEHYDDDTATATKAAIFTRRVIAVTVTPSRVEDPGDAMALVLHERGHVAMERVAELLDVSVPDAVAALGERVFEDPVTGRWAPAETYLAGDVRSRHAAAVTAATTEPERYTRNVVALDAVVPDDLSPGEIEVGFGAPWVPAEVVAGFIRDVLHLERVEVAHVVELAQWTVTVAPWDRTGVRMTAEWGTARRDAIALIEASLNQIAVTVYDQLDDGRRVRNPVETLLALEKQDKLQARFRAWVWSEPRRATELARRYNDLFNSTVAPVWLGAHLRLPGLAAGFVPYRHQRDAVWRIVSAGNTLLAHEVGAGKTATMCMAAMELRRLGLATKPALIVPNHMLEQFTREFLQLYPAANLLVATKDDTTRAERERFVARAATGDWDAVILTHQSFARIPVSSETMTRFTQARLDELRVVLGHHRDRDRSASTHETRTVKRIEKRVAALEATLAKLLDEPSRDVGACFEQTGVDHLFVDEAHYFKNRRIITNVAAVATVASKRAEDLAMKIAWLAERKPDRQATFATGTPVANSIAEMFVMQSYLQPARLRALGIDVFDAWAATFATTVTGVELAPDGGSYRIATRFARFQNVPDLLRVYREIADVQRGDTLGLTRPGLIDDRADTVTAPGTDGLRRYVAELVERAERIRGRLVQPEEDNMLKVTGDGRRAALDLRLAGEPAGDGPGKIGVCAARVADLYARYRDRRYLDPATDLEHPRAGALQVVFCDLGTPGGSGWNVYDALRDELVERGVPRPAIRFIHDAVNDDAKARLFAECRNGHVAVLVGSTEKMGVGTNIQNRLVALHHLDAPWRPADIEQREGRILRPGNQHPRVHIVRYVTEGSFDVYMWQTLERKAAFIGQLQAGRLDARTIDDIATDTALSYGEVKALASGNPLILEKAQLDTEHARLARLAAGWRREHVAVAARADAMTRRLATLERTLTDIDRVVTRRRSTRGDDFAITVDGVRYRARLDGGAALVAAIDRVGRAPTGIGELGGFTILARCDETGVVLSFDEPAIRPVVLSDEDRRSGTPLSIVRRLEDTLVRLDRQEADATAERARVERELADATTQLADTRNPHETRLATVTVRLAAINDALAAAASDVVATVNAASEPLPVTTNVGDVGPTLA